MNKNIVPRRNEIVKNVSVTHCRNKWSLIENKLFNTFLYLAYPTLTESNKEFTIPVLELWEKLQWNDSRNITYLKRALKNLCQTVMEFNLFEDGSHAWVVTTLISYAKIKNGQCTFRFNEEIRPLLAEPDIYHRLKIRLMNLFSSRNSLVLYENCHRFKDILKTPWWTIDDYKSLFGLNPNDYPDRRDWQRRLVKDPVQDINKIADIRLTPEYKKKERRFHWIRFLIKVNTKTNAGLELIGQENLEDAIELLDERAKTFIAQLEKQGVNTKSKKVQDALTKFDINTLEHRFMKHMRDIERENFNINPLTGALTPKPKPVIKKVSGYIVAGLSTEVIHEKKPRLMRCQSCGGEGVSPLTLCSACDGDGCPKCDGDGFFPGTACTLCDDGWITVEAYYESRGES